MKKEKNNFATILTVLGLALAGALTFWMIKDFLQIYFHLPNDKVGYEARLQALGNIFGGFLGAFGAGVSVVLAFRLQERQKRAELDKLIRYIGDDLFFSISSVHRARIRYYSEYYLIGLLGKQPPHFPLGKIEVPTVHQMLKDKPELMTHRRVLQIMRPHIEAYVTACGALDAAIAKFNETVIPRNPRDYISSKSNDEILPLSSTLQKAVAESYAITDLLTVLDKSLHDALKKYEAESDAAANRPRPLGLSAVS